MAAGERNIVAQGGLWNPPRAQYSQQTHNLLKEMMTESKLTNFQQRQISKAMNDGNALPKSVHPTTSASRKPQPVAAPLPKALNPKNYGSHVRHKEAIEASGAYDRETYIPRPLTKFRGAYNKEKERLSNIMAYGKDVPPPDPKKVVQRLCPSTPPKEMDRFMELEREINERRDFLEEMENLGQGDKYRQIIETEISQKILEMEVIDRKRTRELEETIRRQEMAKNK